MISFFATGTLLGLSAGFAPGPLLALVIAETLQHDAKAGIKVAVAPALTDLPIILLTVFALAKLAHFEIVLDGISLAGGCLVLYLGYGCLTTKGLVVASEEIRPRSLQKGVVVNLLSPHPYLFWFSVGGPMILKAAERSLWAAWAFIAGFYGFLIGSKVLLALAAGKSRSALTGRAYLYTMRFLGLALCGFALLLFRDGVTLLRIL